MTKRLISIVLSLMLVLSMASFASAEDSGELSILNTAPKKHVYTEIGFEYNGNTIVLYGYIDKEGTPQYRVYGKIGKTKGFFPVEVNGENDLTVLSTETVKDNTKDFGNAKIADEKTDIPDGFKKTNKKNIFKMVNIFNEGEHVAYASYDGENYYYFPIAKNNQPVAGSFPYDIEAMLERSKARNNNKSVRKPVEFKKGFSKDILIFTTDGEQLSVKTTGPVVDVDELGAKRRPSYSGGGSSSGKSSNANLKNVQYLLKKLGFLSGPVDGKMGEQTKKAISAFQAKNGLVQTGTLDKGTQNKLASDSLVNSKGETVYVRDLSFGKDQKAARESVKGLEVAMSIKYGSLSTNENQTFTIQVKKNPNGVNNFNYILEVKGPEIWRTNVGAVGGSVSHQFKAAGSYRAVLYVNSPHGIVNGLGDVKTFTVTAGSALPKDGKITQEDANNDRFLSINYGGSHNKSVKKNDFANISVSAANTIAGHTYRITVAGPNLNSTINGTSFNQNVQMLDDSAKNYTVTVTGYLNGNPTRTVTGTFKILAPNTGSSSSGGTVEVENAKEYTVKLHHQGDVPSGTSDTTQKIKHGTLFTPGAMGVVEKDGYKYTPSAWNPGSATITSDTTFVCTWTKTAIAQNTPEPADTPKPTENNGGGGSTEDGNAGNDGIPSPVPDTPINNN